MLFSEVRNGGDLSRITLRQGCSVGIALSCRGWRTATEHDGVEKAHPAYSISKNKLPLEPGMDVKRSKSCRSIP